jgi:hypothetical protein
LKQRKKYNTYRRYEALPYDVREMGPNEFHRVGPLIVQSELFKYSSKFLSREEYHRWIDNDLRDFD